MKLISVSPKCTLLVSTNHTICHQILFHHKTPLRTLLRVPHLWFRVRAAGDRGQPVCFVRKEDSFVQGWGERSFSWREIMQFLYAFLWKLG